MASEPRRQLRAMRLRRDPSRGAVRRQHDADAALPDLPARLRSLAVRRHRGSTRGTVIGNLAVLFLFGRLSDQLGRRPVALAGLGVSAASAVCFLVADGITWLAVGRVLSGFARRAWRRRADRVDRGARAAEGPSPCRGRHQRGKPRGAGLRRPRGRLARGVRALAAQAQLGTRFDAPGGRRRDASAGAGDGGATGARVARPGAAPTDRGATGPSHRVHGRRIPRLCHLRARRLLRGAGAGAARPAHGSNECGDRRRGGRALLRGRRDHGHRRTTASRHR